MEPTTTDDAVREALDRADELWDEGQPTGPDFDNPDGTLLADAGLLRRLAGELLALRRLLAAGHAVRVGPHPLPPPVPDRHGHWPLPAFPTDTERLDWLDRNRVVLMRANTRPDQWRVEADGRMLLRATARQALDAAAGWVP